jgi:hypothetical protein
MEMAIKFQVKEEDFAYGNGVWTDPVLYETHEEAQSQCHSTRGWVEEVEIKVIEKSFAYFSREDGRAFPCAFVDHTSDGRAIYRDMIGRRVATTRDEAHAMAKARSRLETHGTR